MQTLNPETGGVARAVTSLSKGLQQHGVEVEIVALDQPESPWLRDQSLTVHALGQGLSNLVERQVALGGVDTVSRDVDVLWGGAHLPGV